MPCVGCLASDCPSKGLVSACKEDARPITLYLEIKIKESNGRRLTQIIQAFDLLTRSWRYMMPEIISMKLRHAQVETVSIQAKAAKSGV